MHLSRDRDKPLDMHCYSSGSGWEGQRDHDLSGSDQQLKMLPEMTILGT